MKNIVDILPYLRCKKSKEVISWLKQLKRSKIYELNFFNSQMQEVIQTYLNQLNDSTNAHIKKAQDLIQNTAKFEKEWGKIQTKLVSELIAEYKNDLNKHTKKKNSDLATLFGLGTLSKFQNWHIRNLYSTYTGESPNYSESKEAWELMDKAYTLNMNLKVGGLKLAIQAHEMAPHIEVTKFVLGCSYLLLRDYDKALSLLKSSAESSWVTYYVYQSYAECLTKLGNHEEAEIQYDNAIENAREYYCDGALSFILTEKALFLLELRKIDDAIAFAEYAKSLYCSESNITILARAYKEKGQSFQRAGKVEGARNFFDKSVQIIQDGMMLYLNSSDLYSELGASLVAKKDYKAAIKACDKALAESSCYLIPLSHKVNSLIGLGNYKAAQKSIEKIEKVLENDGDIGFEETELDYINKTVSKKSEIITLIKELQDQKLDMQLSQKDISIISEALDNNTLIKCIAKMNIPAEKKDSIASILSASNPPEEFQGFNIDDLYDFYINQHPNHITPREAWILMDEASLLNYRSHPGSLKLAIQAHEMAPHIEVTKFVLGCSYLVANEYEKALPFLKSSAESSWVTYYVYQKYAECLAKLGNHEEAEIQYDAAIEDAKKHYEDDYALSEIMIAKTVFLLGIGRIDDAISAAEHVMRLCNRSESSFQMLARAYKEKAQCFKKAGRNEEACRLFAKSMAIIKNGMMLYPNSLHLCLDLGANFIAQGNDKGAVEYFDKKIFQYPCSLIGLSHKANALINIGKYEEAVESIEKIEQCIECSKNNNFDITQINYITKAILKKPEILQLIKILKDPNSKEKLSKRTQSAVSKSLDKYVSSIVNPINSPA